VYDRANDEGPRSVPARTCHLPAWIHVPDDCRWIHMPSDLRSIGFTFQMAAVYLPVTAPPANVPDFGEGDGSGGVIVRTPLATFEMLFFSLFGLVDPWNLPPLSRNPWWSISVVGGTHGGRSLWWVGPVVVYLSGWLNPRWSISVVGGTRGGRSLWLVEPMVVDLCGGWDPWWSICLEQHVVVDLCGR